MGIIVKQEDNRTELQKRIATELSDKAKKKHEPIGDRPDGVDDSAYIQGTKESSGGTWLWIGVIVVVCLGAVIYYVSVSGN